MPTLEYDNFEEMGAPAQHSSGMTTTNKRSSCGICETSNLPSACHACVNYRLNEYSCKLRLLRSKRDALYAKLTKVLVTKGKADDQQSWRVLKNEKLARLRDKLKHQQKQVLQGKAKIENVSHDLKVKHAWLETAANLLEKNSGEQIEKYYPNLICTQRLRLMEINSECLHKQSVLIKQICNVFPQHRMHTDGETEDGYSGPYDTICDARLPRGLDTHSVPCAELAASLGYMLQLLNLVVRVMCAPALQNSGFAGSSSRIWQRESYWDAHPSSRSSENRLFIPREDVIPSGGETSWFERSTNNFGVASMESEREPHLDFSPGGFNYSSASAHSTELRKELQKGISLLKKSVACVTAYCYNCLGLEVPSNASTFETFAKLLAALSSSTEDQSVLSLRTESSCKPCQQLNTSVWKVESAVSSSTLMESAQALPYTRNAFDNYIPNFAANCLYANEFLDSERNGNLNEGWNLVEHPTFPPPPSQAEDVEHWTRAMFTDATKK